MKTLISLLTLIILTTLAQAEYVDNPDGTVTYVGSCLLHEDYDGVQYRSVDLTDYFDRPSITILDGLTPLQKDLVIVTIGELAYDFHLVLNEQDYLFDDIQLMQIIPTSSSLANKGPLYRVSYGVGGGNGGFLTFELKAIVEVPGKTHHHFSLLSSTFDGDVLSCQ
jgi:hypothetical protein